MKAIKIKGKIKIKKTKKSKMRELTPEEYRIFYKSPALW